jgi:hypothetical protein
MGSPTSTRQVILVRPGTSAVFRLRVNQAQRQRDIAWVSWVPERIACSFPVGRRSGSLSRAAGSRPPPPRRIPSPRDAAGLSLQATACRRRGDTVHPFTG